MHWHLFVIFGQIDGPPTLPPIPPQLLKSTAKKPGHTFLTITLLIPCPRARTPKLLRLAAAIVGHQQGAIVLHEGLLQLVLGVLVHVLLVVRHDGLGDGLADGVDLGRVAAASDADADVHPGEFVQAEDEERFVDLIFGLGVRKRFVRKGGTRGEICTLKRRISGCARERGFPFTLTRPLPR